MKTCEEYVLEQLHKSEEKVAELQTQLESLYQDWCDLKKGHKELLDKYDTLRQALYESLIEIEDEIPYMTFKGYYSHLFNDVPGYHAIKEAIDSWAKEIAMPVEEDTEEKNESNISD